MSNYLLTLLRCKFASKKGQGMTEYALILALVVALGIAVLSTDNTLHDGIIKVFKNVSSQLDSVGTAAKKTT